MPKKHDPFFKAGLAYPQLAHAFFKYFLPADVQRYIDLSGLKLERENFVDERLKRKVADVLFSVPYAGSEGFLYLLVEHQSRPDPMMAFRLRQYVDAVKDLFHKQHGGPVLPLIYPLVCYSGERAYTAPRQMADLVAGPQELVERCLNGPHQVIVLSEIPDEKLRNHHFLWAYLGLLKHIHSGDLTALLLDMIPAFLQIEKEDQGSSFLVQALRYAMDSGEAKNFDRVLETLNRTASEATKGAIMTIAETLIEKGKEIGIEQGKEIGIEQGKEIGVQEGIQKTALNLLRAGSEETFIAQVTGFTLEEIRALKDRLNP